MLERRNALARELELLEAEIERVAYESLCGARDGCRDVELYDGTLGVSRLFVDHHEPAVGQLQWLEALGDRFSGDGDSAGDVAGVRWGSGAMVSADLFLTAGHCFDPAGGGWRRPVHDGEALSPAELATLMRVNFDYQLDGQTGELRRGESYPVFELVEHRLGGLDYALVRLGPGESGASAGTRHGYLPTADRDLTRPGAPLCLIQHGHGLPKRIEVGPLLDNEGGRIRYESLDAAGGASGACLLSTDGRIVGVHTHGGCAAFSGANHGVAIGAIRAVSAALPPAPRRSTARRHLHALR